jgi:hypothetical protein
VGRGPRQGRDDGHLGAACDVLLARRRRIHRGSGLRPWSAQLPCSWVPVHVAGLGAGGHTRPASRTVTTTRASSPARRDRGRLRLCTTTKSPTITATTPSSSSAVLRNVSAFDTRPQTPVRCEQDLRSVADLLDRSAQRQPGPAEELPPVNLVWCLCQSQNSTTGFENRSVNGARAKVEHRGRTTGGRDAVRRAPATVVPVLQTGRRQPIGRHRSTSLFIRHRVEELGNLQPSSHLLDNTFRMLEATMLPPDPVAR